MTAIIDPKVRAQLLHVLTIDAQKPNRNPYAIAHYCGALQHAEEMMATEGKDLRGALMSAFCGPIVNRLVKAAGMPKLTDEEIRQVR